MLSSYQFSTNLLCLWNNTEALITCFYHILSTGLMLFKTFSVFQVIIVFQWKYLIAQKRKKNEAKKDNLCKNWIEFSKTEAKTKLMTEVKISSIVFVERNTISKSLISHYDHFKLKIVALQKKIPWFRLKSCTVHGKCLTFIEESRYRLMFTPFA